MEIFILNKNFQAVGVIDQYESFIWTERYNTCGDFEIYTVPADPLMSVIQEDYYIYRNDSDTVMVVESINIETDVEEGSRITITGRSLESILDRRIVWTQTELNGKLQNCVKKLLNENVISPEIADRRIPNFIFSDSTDPAVTSLNHKAQYTGDNLLSVITEICQANNLGFRIRLNSSNQFVFSLFAGKDHTYDQFVNPYVVFSPEFDNLINSTYLLSGTTVRNVNLVAGEDDGEVRRRRAVGTASGLDRKELYTDARDIQSEKTDGTSYTESEYYALLDDRGNKKLAEHQKTTAFDGRIDHLHTFEYGVDYFIGDKVQIVNEFGFGSTARVMEFIYTHDSNGISKYPTFDIREATTHTGTTNNVPSTGGGGGGTGTTDYRDLENKPQIEGVTLNGNVTFATLGLRPMTVAEVEAILTF